MALPAPDVRRYFLGIQGSQSGPFSEEEVLGRIRSKQVPQDALVWYEGLPDWQPVLSIEYFRGAFSGAPPTEAERRVSEVETQELPRAVVQALVRNGEPDGAGEASAPDGVEPPAESAQEPARAAPSTAFVPYKPSSEAAVDPFAYNGGSLEPVFKAEEAKFANEGGNSAMAELLKDHGKKIGMVAGAVVGLVITYFAWSAFSKLTPAAAPFEPKSHKPVALTGDERQVQVTQSLSQLELSPDQALLGLKKLIEVNADDKAGKEALQAVLEYYKRLQRPSDAGRFLMEIKRPADAYPWFLEEPASYTEADRAASAAIEMLKGDRRKEFLLEDIRLLIGPLQNEKGAVARIQQFEKEFPGAPHPFGFYLKSVDDKIVDLFSRISFFYVQTVLDFLGSELPQITFLKHPLVEVKRSKTGGYRIVATYEGEITLNREPLSGMRFVFWLSGDQWTLVDTNLSPERKKFSDQARERLKAQELSAPAMLSYLEVVFRRQFPKANLYENVTSEKKAQPKDF